MKSPLPNDEQLPDWLHTTLVMGLVSVFGLPLIWSGVNSLLTGTLLPISGPDFGTWMIGPSTMHGLAATAGGLAIVVLGMAFLMLGIAWTRWAVNRHLLKMAPWGLLAIAALFMVWARVLSNQAQI